MGIEQLIAGRKTIAVVCNQWGDTGKGKLVDLLADWADIIVRGNGGANAGHTVRVGDEELIQHLMPSGIRHDGKGNYNCIGPGVVVDPFQLAEEMNNLDRAGHTYNNLRIAYNAALVLPQHIVQDVLTEHRMTGAIGTTGRGIGPAYTDLPLRIGLTINDMLNPDILRSKLARNMSHPINHIDGRDREFAAKVLHGSRLQKGRFFDANMLFNTDAIVDAYVELGERFAPFIDDVERLVRDAHGKRKILLEGAQGLLLSVKYGSKPFVTSSDPSIYGLAAGVGLEKRDVDFVIGVMKGFYMTRVGEGPFPTELGGKKSDAWCSTRKLADEEATYGDASVNSKDEFEQGIAIRRAGKEYGATTGRLRRTGWLDLPLLRYAVQINGPHVALTKLDVLDECDEIKVCTVYDYKGPPYNLPGRLVGSRDIGARLESGNMFMTAIPDAEVLKHCKPCYVSFPGWKCRTAGIRDYTSLPPEMTRILQYVRDQVDVRPVMLSVGADRDANVFLPEE